MAASTPVKDEIELFPRVRVVPGYCTSPPSYSPVPLDRSFSPAPLEPSYSPTQPSYSPALPSYSPAPPRTMPQLLPVSSAKRKLNWDSPTDGRGRPTVAPPSTPTGAGEPAPRRRRLELELDPTLVVPGRRLTRRLWETVRDAAAAAAVAAAASPARVRPELPAGDLSWASLSSVHQSCTPSRFERDSPLSPSPAKSPLQDDSPRMAPPDEQSCQSCSPSRFERDSPLSPPSAEKTRSTARQTAYREADSPAPSTSRAGVTEQAWAPFSPSRFERDSPLSPTPTLSPGMPAPSAFEEVQLSRGSEQASLITSASEQPSQLSNVSARLDMSMTRSARARAYLEQSALSDVSVSMLLDKTCSPAASSKRSWASPAPVEPSSSRPRRRRAAAAFAAVPSPNLPPKKRRRFRSPSPAPAPVRSLSQLGRDGPRVIVEAAGQPLTQSFYSLRSGAGRR